MIGVDNIITDRPIPGAGGHSGRGKCGESAGAAEGAAAVKKDYRKNKNQEKKHEICTTESQTRECKGRRRADRPRSAVDIWC